jgi:alpha-tubulin suppressor-like RCC1 family protein
VVVFGQVLVVFWLICYFVFLNQFKNFLQSTECGKLFSVGNNEFCCIGDGTYDDCSIIKQINYFSNIIIVDVACGYDFCLSI